MPVALQRRQREHLGELSKVKCIHDQLVSPTEFASQEVNLLEDKQCHKDGLSLGIQGARLIPRIGD